MNQDSPAPVALITGAARRVGATIATCLHSAGYRVALHYRHSADDAMALAYRLESERHASTLLLAADLADPSTPSMLVEQVLQTFGRLDVLVNNASSFYPTPLASADAGQWDELFASNARAPFFLAQAAAPALRAARGNIVNMLDIYAERALADHPIYVMAKAALLAMTRTLALDLAPRVRVNGVAPGAVLWPDSGKSYTDQQALLARTPLGHAGQPEDIANAVLWLVRDATYVSGQIIRVDGGRTVTV